MLRKLILSLILIVVFLLLEIIAFFLYLLIMSLDILKTATQYLTTLTVLLPLSLWKSLIKIQKGEELVTIQEGSLDLLTKMQEDGSAVKLKVSKKKSLVLQNTGS